MNTYYVDEMSILLSIFDSMVYLSRTICNQMSVEWIELPIMNATAARQIVRLIYCE